MKLVIFGNKNDMTRNSSFFKKNFEEFINKNEEKDVNVLISNRFQAVRRKYRGALCFRQDSFKREQIFVFTLQ